MDGKKQIKLLDVKPYPYAPCSKRLWPSLSLANKSHAKGNEKVDPERHRRRTQFSETEKCHLTLLPKQNATDPDGLVPRTDNGHRKGGMYNRIVKFSIRSFVYRIELVSNEKGVGKCMLAVRPKGSASSVGSKVS